MGENMYKTTGTFVPDSLIADNAIAITTKGVTIAAGQGILKRGTLLGASQDGYKVTGSMETPDTNTEEEAEGEDTEKEAEGGSKIGCDGILTDDVDTTKEGAVAAIYITGTFNRNAIILAEGEKIETYETELRKLGIFLKTVQEY